MWRPFKDQGVEDGRREVEEEGSVVLTGAPYSTLLSSGLFQAGRKRRGMSEFFFFSHSLAQLNCGFTELPFVDSCTRMRCCHPLICFNHFIVMCTLDVVSLYYILVFALIISSRQTFWYWLDGIDSWDDICRDVTGEIGGWTCYCYQFQYQFPKLF